MVRQINGQLRVRRWLRQRQVCIAIHLYYSVEAGTMIACTFHNFKLLFKQLAVLQDAGSPSSESTALSSPKVGFPEIAALSDLLNSDTSMLYHFIKMLQRKEAAHEITELNLRFWLHVLNGKFASTRFLSVKTKGINWNISETVVWVVMNTSKRHRPSIGVEAGWISYPGGRSNVCCSMPKHS